MKSFEYLLLKFLVVRTVAFEEDRFEGYESLVQEDVDQLKLYDCSNDLYQLKVNEAK